MYAMLFRKRHSGRRTWQLFSLDRTIYIKIYTTMDLKHTTLDFIDTIHINIWFKTFLFQQQKKYNVQTFIRMWCLPFSVVH